MTKQKDFMPMVYEFMNVEMDKVQNTNLFNSYLKTNNVEKVYTGTLWAEGPCYIPHKDMLIWSDNPNNRMLKLVNGKVSEFINPSNFCNGNTLDNDNNLISCSHGGRCVYKIDDELNISIMVDKYEGKKLNSPNDVCVKSDGSIWFTDPPYGILSNYEGYLGEQEYGGCFVFKYDPKLKKLEVMSKNLDRPNGIAFSHDENIWTSAGKAIKCFNPHNELIGQILVPELVSNLEFGGTEGNTLYITATSSLYKIELNQVGAKYK